MYQYTVNYKEENGKYSEMQPKIVSLSRACQVIIGKTPPALKGSFPYTIDLGYPIIAVFVGNHYSQGQPQYGDVFSGWCTKEFPLYDTNGNDIVMSISDNTFTVFDTPRSHILKGERWMWVAWCEL